MTHSKPATRARQAAALLGQDRVIGKRAEDVRDDRGLALAVGARHQVVLRLLLGPRSLAP